MNKPVLVLGDLSLASAPNVVTETFQKFDEKLIRANDVKDFEVATDESCEVAELKVKSIIEMEKAVEAARIRLKDPINAIGNIIQAEAKKRAGELGDAKTLLNKKILTFKNLKQAQLIAEQKKKEQEGLKEVEEKKLTAERINRIVYQLRSLLFGGELVNKDGEFKPVKAPESVEDLDKIMELIRKSFPDFAAFGDFKDEVVVIRSEFEEDITYYKNHLGDDLWINVLKVKYDKMCKYWDMLIGKVVEKETKKVEKAINQEIKDAGKGVKELVRYEVTNFELVSDRFKEIAKGAVQEYIREHLDNIKAAIKADKGDEVLTGIQFRIDKIHATR